MPALDAAINRNSAEFSLVVQAFYGAKPELNLARSEEHRQAYEERIDAIFEAFESAYGSLEKAFYCESIVAAAALTCRSHSSDRRTFWRGSRRSEEFKLHYVKNASNNEDVEILRLLDRAERLQIDAKANLRGKDLRVCMERIYSVMSNLLHLLDQRFTDRGKRARKPDDLSLIELQREELVDATTFYKGRAQRDAQVQYFGGMMVGVFMVAAAAVALSLADLPGSDVNVLASFVAGAVGAVVSVLSRMASNSLLLAFEAGTGQIRTLGLFRPFVGAIFGALFYFILASEILPIEVPIDKDRALFFFIVAAFLSGFFERWAQDMLVVTRQTLTPGSPDTGQSQRSSESPDTEA